MKTGDPHRKGRREDPQTASRPDELDYKSQRNILSRNEAGHHELYGQQWSNGVTGTVPKNRGIMTTSYRVRHKLVEEKPACPKHGIKCMHRDYRYHKVKKYSCRFLGKHWDNHCGFTIELQ